MVAVKPTARSRFSGRTSAIAEEGGEYVVAVIQGRGEYKPYYHMLICKGPGVEVGIAAISTITGKVGDVLRDLILADGS